MKMTELLLVVAFVVISILFIRNKKLKCELRVKSFEVSDNLKQLSSLGNKVDCTKTEISSLRRAYEKEVAIYQKALEDGVSFKQAEIILEELKKQKEFAAQLQVEKEIRVQKMRDSAFRSKYHQSRGSSASKKSSQPNQSSRDVFDDSNDNSNDDYSGSSSSDNSYHGGGGDFGGGGSGGSW